jgi:hypothetical protein
MNVIVTVSRAERGAYMKTFTIDADNNISVFTSKEEAAAASVTPFGPFTSQSELAEVAAEWPASRLVEIWNGIPGVTAITKFTSKKIATERIWKAIQNLGAEAAKAAEPLVEVAPAEITPVSTVAEPEIIPDTGPEAQVIPEVVTAIEPEVTPESIPAGSEAAPDVAPAEESPAIEPTRKTKAPKAPKKATPSKAEGVRAGSKTAIVIALMERKDGVTLAEIMTATGWQAHSVRGFISGTLGKKMGRTVDSTKGETGERIYQLR